MLKPYRCIYCALLEIDRDWIGTRGDGRCPRGNCKAPYEVRLCWLFEPAGPAEVVQRIARG